MCWRYKWELEMKKQKAKKFFSLVMAKGDFDSVFLTFLVSETL